MAHALRDFVCQGTEDYRMTVRFPYDFRTVPVCHHKKLQGDRKESKHNRHSLESSTIPGKCN